MTASYTLDTCTSTRNHTRMMDTKNTTQLCKTNRRETNELGPRDLGGSARSPREPLLVSKRETGELLRVCLRTVDNLIANGELKCVRIGKRVLVKYSSVLAFTKRDHVTSTPASAKELTQ
jgi:excisionase family DNA binding protein